MMICPLLRPVISAIEIKTALQEVLEDSLIAAVFTRPARLWTSVRQQLLHICSPEL